MLIDLQLHSTYSDGYLTPNQLVEFIASNGIKVASLTDHNTVYGQEEFKRECIKNNIKAIPGLELYVTFFKKRLNILWYNMDCSSAELSKILRETQVRRRASVRGHLEILNKLGFKIDIHKIMDKHIYYIPINRVIDGILASSYNREKIKKETKEKIPREYQIIHKYFYNSKMPHIMSESYTNIERVMRLRKKIGGQIILNHPGKRDHLNPDLFKKLKKIGVDGIEVLSPHHNIRSIMYAQSLAKELNLIATGSSDFHRFEGNKAPIQSSLNYFKIDSEMLRGVERIINYK